MDGWIDRLTSTRTERAVEIAARFAEERNRVLAENVANIDTPDFQSRVIDPQAFQATLQKALQRSHDSNDALDLRGNAQVSTDSEGRLVVRPGREPAPNALFHDGTNARLEQLLSDTAENSLYYNLATSLLRSQFETLQTAIRGRIA